MTRKKVRKSFRKKYAGFSLVEILTVLVVLGILTAMTTLGYNVWQDRIAEDQVLAALKSAKTSMENAKNFSSSKQYPATVNYSPGPDVTITGGATNSNYSYCIRGQSNRRTGTVYYITNTDPEPSSTACTYP